MEIIVNTELQQRLIAELRRPGLSWKDSRDHVTNSDNYVRWIPVANLPAARLELGLSLNAMWVRVGSGSVTEFIPDKPCVFLLPILEIPFEEAHRLLMESLQAIGLSKDFLLTFPFEDILITASDSHSERWANLMLGWAKEMPNSTRLQAALERLAADGPTQKIKHSAQQLLVRQRKAL